MEKQMAEINEDLSEMESLLNVASRQRIKNFLSIEIRRLISKKLKLEESFRNEKTPDSKKVLRPYATNFLVKLDQYAWDQSPKYIKLFLTLPKVHQLASENIKCQFNPDSLTLTVTNLDDKNFEFKMAELLHSVLPEESYWRVKSDTIVIFLVKSSALKWQYLTKTDEKKAREKKKEYKTEKSGEQDGTSLFNLMKDMYAKGDDELKKTIAQAWTEGQPNR